MVFVPIQGCEDHIDVGPDALIAVEGDTHLIEGGRFRIAEFPVFGGIGGGVEDRSIDATNADVLGFGGIGDEVVDGLVEEWQVEGFDVEGALGGELLDSGSALFEEFEIVGGEETKERSGGQGAGTERHQDERNLVGDLGETHALEGDGESAGSTQFATQVLPIPTRLLRKASKSEEKTGGS